MEKRPQTFLEACQEFHDAVTEIGHVLLASITPYVEWLRKKLEALKVL